jgi:hypothetical protein
MQQVNHANLKHMGIFQFLEHMEHWFAIHHLYETLTRIQFLELGIQDLALRAELHSVLAEAATEGGRELTWSEVREYALQQFSPPTWLQEVMQGWRSSQDQGSKTAFAWITDFSRWNAIIRPIAGKNAISPKMEALLLRGGANPELNSNMSIRPYKIFNPMATKAHVQMCAGGMANGGAVRQKETAAVRKLDAEADKAITQLKLCEAKLNYMVYTGELANWLCKDMNVSEELFNARKQQRVCFACGKDHLLYACPQYTPEIIDRVGKKRFDQGVTTGEGRERGQFREQRMRDKVQGLTNSGRNNQWKQSFRRDKAHGRKLDNGSETLNIRRASKGA